MSYIVNIGGTAVHVYTSNWQPLTRYFDPHVPPNGRWIKVNPRKVYRCHECRDWRWAAKLKIQVYYDRVNILCADGCYGARGGRL